MSTEWPPTRIVDQEVVLAPESEHFDDALRDMLIYDEPSRNEYHSRFVESSKVARGPLSSTHAMRAFHSSLLLTSQCLGRDSAICFS
jgi:hypothetical protein